MHLGYTWGGRRCAIINQGVAGGALSLVRVWGEVCHHWWWCDGMCALVCQGVGGGASWLHKGWQEVRHH